jgi:hypothetical protein
MKVPVLPVSLPPGTTLTLLHVLSHLNGGYSTSTMLHIDAIMCGSYVSDVFRARQVGIRQVMSGV